MILLKKLIKRSQIVFCLGTDRNERYEVFRPFLSEKLRRYMYDDNIKHTFVLFVSEEEEGFYENERGDLISLFKREENDQIRYLYLPISKKYLPKGFVFILPPPCEIEDELEYKEEVLNFNHQEWVKSLYKIIWFDFFPYAKYTDIYAIRALQNNEIYNNGKIDMDIALIISGRRFAATDLMSEEEAIEKSIEIYKNEDVGNHYHTLRINERIEILSDILGNKNSYADSITCRLVNDIMNQYELFKKYFDEDYEYVINDIITVDKLEALCGYEKWLANNKELKKSWIDAFEQEIFYEIICSIYTFISQNYLISISLKDCKEEFDQLMLEKFRILKMKLMKKAIFRIDISSEVDRLEYLNITKKMKVYFKQEIYDFATERLKEEIYKYIDEKYLRWVDLSKN